MWLYVNNNICGGDMKRDWKPICYGKKKKILPTNEKHILV